MFSLSLPCITCRVTEGVSLFSWKLSPACLGWWVSLLCQRCFSLRAPLLRWGEAGLISLWNCLFATNGLWHLSSVRCIPAAATRIHHIGWRAGFLTTEGTSASLTFCHTVVWGLHSNSSAATMLAGATAAAKLYLLKLFLSFSHPTSPMCSNIPTFRSLRHVVCSAEEPLLDYRCLTCNFQGKYKGIFSPCYDADVLLHAF